MRERDRERDGEREFRERGERIRETGEIRERYGRETGEIRERDGRDTGVETDHIEIEALSLSSTRMNPGLQDLVM